MNFDIKRVRSISFRLHELCQSVRTEAAEDDRIRGQIGSLESELRSRCGFDLGRIQLSGSHPSQCFVSLGLMERTRFMIIERLHSSSNHVPELVDFISFQILDLHNLKPSDRRLRIESVHRITRDQLGSDFQDSTNDRLLARFIIELALGQVRDPEARLTFLIDDPDDAETTNHILEARFEVLLANTDLHSNVLKMAENHVDPISLIISPGYPDFCALMKEVNVDSGDPHHSRLILESLYKLSTERFYARSESALSKTQHAICILLVLLITLDSVPPGLYLHFKLVDDFFRGDPFISEITPVFVGLFKLVQKVSADPPKDFISLLE